MRKLYLLVFLYLTGLLYSQTNFHDTQGSIDVNGGGQLQFTLPIALPPGVKSVAPQMNLVYTGGSGNGIAGYGWSLSGITSISRMGKTLETDNEIKGIQLDYSDYYSFNGQRLILKSGEYGKNGAEYVTEKFSNIKIKSVGAAQSACAGPMYFHVTFEDGSQAWYGDIQDDNPEYDTYNGRGCIDYNIVRWQDAQGNSIIYQYEETTGMMQGGVQRISSIKWGGNESLSRPHFNEISFTYKARALQEVSYAQGFKFVQDKILDFITVRTNGSQFKKYQITHSASESYAKVSFITEYNSQDEAANPIVFNYQGNPSDPTTSRIEDGVKNTHTKKYGDFDFDGITDFIEMESNGNLSFKKSVYLNTSSIPLTYNSSEFTLSDFRDATLITYKKDNVVAEKAGLVIPVKKARPNMVDVYDYEFRIYSVNLQTQTMEFQYSKNLMFESFKAIQEPESFDSNCTYKPSSIDRIFSYDYDGDGISEIIAEISYERTCYTEGPIDPNDPQPWRVANSTKNSGKSENSEVIPDSIVGVIKPVLKADNTELPREETSISGSDGFQANAQMRPPADFTPVTVYENSALLFDLKQETPNASSYFRFNHGYSQSIVPLEVADFNGDGIEELFTLEAGYLRKFLNIKKNSSGSFYTEAVINATQITGLTGHMVYGDYNGDGKVDLAVPQVNKSSNWKFYLSTGKGFDVHDYNNFIYFSSRSEITGQGIHNTFFESGCDYFTQTNYQYQAVDLDQDGKSEIVVTKLVINNHKWNAHNDQENTAVSLSVYSVNRPSTISPIGTTTLPFQFGLTKPYSEQFPNKVIPFQSLFINKTNRQIILVGRPDDCPISNCDRINVISLDYFHVPTNTRLSQISQGGLVTDVEFSELLSGYVYQPAAAMAYPYLSLNKINKSYVVSRLTQGGRLQDFRYRGLTTHLHGKGMLGFRQMARSSWYAPGFESTKIWSGVEADPLRDNIPIKEWSIKTNTESQIFPTNISLTNTQLLSVKLTDYKTEYWINGVKKTAITQTEKPKAVSAVVPIASTAKDFMSDVKTYDTIVYNEYYLPTITVSKINDTFATKTTNLEYFPPNLTGVGSSYHVGRPKSKTELMQVYGDSKGAKEDYEYENNLLKTKTTYNRNNTGWIKESYLYDGFGNITQKTLSNSVDAHTKISKAQYDTQGRFVLKKNDIAGTINLETNITYNNWGQVLTESDPMGGVLTNTYDAWGKLLTSKHNLAGTTTYQYEKLYNGDAKATQTEADGNVSISYTNKIGQNYKTTTKGFNSGTYISKTIEYDALGRKLRESEPYTEGQTPNQWNTVQYDDYSRPVKLTSFTGKIVDNTYAGRTTTVTETNANGRFRKQTTDAIGNIISSQDKGGIITYKYNAAGENTEAKYDTNIVTTSYDAWGRKSEVNDPSNGLYKYDYNGFGQLVKETSPKGYKQYTYNTSGLLSAQTEVTTDGTQNTQKSITYSYNTKGQLTLKNGTSKGKSFSTTLAYDAYGRLLSSVENSNGKTFSQQGILYDALSRISSYEKRLVSSGITTKATIENIYHSWSGELYQVKDKTAGKLLWELQQTNARGQVTLAKLGTAQITNQYAINGFLSNINHATPSKTFLQITYSFNAIKNELNSRNTGGDFNILETFEYDDNNRLVNWTDPVTNAYATGTKRNIYDAKGRITENDQLGSIKFENNQFVYRPTSIVLNTLGQQNLQNDLIQKIVYNENNDPVFIDGKKGDVRFEYGLSEMRQMATYGGEFLASGTHDGGNTHGKFTKYYSEDGSFEVIRNNQTGQEKHLIYIGGSPYESNIVYVKNYTESSGSYKFLHKDYLGSVLAISDEAGNKLEQRHFDAWGSLTHLKIGNNATITDKNQIRDYLSNGNLIVDRGYTSHEHFAEVGIIHMNGRLYDPLLRRFLNADENIQDMFNTQNYNKYGYVLNNPLMYNDPSGEFLGVIFTIFKIASIVFSTINTINTAIALYYGNTTLIEVVKGFVFSVASKAFTLGIGELFKAGGKIAEALGDWVYLAKVGAHAISQTVLSTMQGGNFSNSLVKGLAVNAAVQGVQYLAGVAGNASFLKTEGNGADVLQAGDVATAIADDIRTQLLPEVVLTSKANWQKQLINHITSNVSRFWADINLQQNRNRLAYAIRNSNIAQEIGAVENFLFSEVPQTLVGGPGLRIFKAGKVAAKGISEGTHLVYQGFDKAGVVKYVGITGRDVAVRFGEHLNSGTGRSLLRYEVVPGATNLSKTGARIWEQNLINQHGLDNLLNIRNSIAPKYWFQYGIKP